MSSGYALPVSAWITGEDGQRIVVLPDGKRMPVEEWKKIRVTPEEFARLAWLKGRNRASRSSAPEDPDDL
jgi:hypothetical protein